MKVKSLLALAAKCKSNEDAQNLLNTLSNAMTKNKALASLSILNGDYALEEDGPFVMCDLNLLISNEYGLKISPEIRDGKLSVVICVDHLEDKLGMQSQKVQPVTDMQESIEATDDQTLSELAESCVELAVDFHCQLVESVGVPPAVAKKVVKSIWKN